MNTLHTEINNLDPIAKVAAYKAVAHSSMARAFNAIQRKIRNAETPKTISAAELDKDMVASNDEPTNDTDSERENEQYTAPSEFDTDRESIESQISKYATLYKTICDELQTPEAHSRWDVPMEPETMLDFMISSSGEDNSAGIEEIAKSIHIDPASLKFAMEQEDRNRKALLIRDKTQILTEFNSYTMSESNEAAWDAIAPVDRHQLGIKAVLGLEKTRDRRAVQILRSKRLSNLSDLTVLQDARRVLSLWCLDMENTHPVEMDLAEEQGRQILLIETIITKEELFPAPETK